MHMTYSTMALSLLASFSEALLQQCHAEHHGSPHGRTALMPKVITFDRLKRPRPPRQCTGPRRARCLPSTSQPLENDSWTTNQLTYRRLSAYRISPRPFTIHLPGLGYILYRLAYHQESQISLLKSRQYTSRW